MSYRQKKFDAVSIVSLIIIIFGNVDAHGDLIVNGDFEDNSAAGDIFNPSNDIFNGVMSNVTAYGIREGIDVMTIGSGFGSVPQSGDWKVTPAADAGGDTEEFSFDLSSQLSSGELYQLEFYMERLISGPFDGGKVEIGLSDVPANFGTLVHTSTKATDGWSLESTIFVAPINANFLTVRVNNGDNHWVGLDNFSLSQIVLGDVNCDGEVNLLDVAPFVAVTSSGVYNFKADINQDGAVDLLDVAPFVDLLSGG